LAYRPQNNLLGTLEILRISCKEIDVEMYMKQFETWQ